MFVNSIHTQVGNAVGTGVAVCGGGDPAQSPRSNVTGSILFGLLYIHELLLTHLGGCTQSPPGTDRLYVIPSHPSYCTSEPAVPSFEQNSISTQVSVAVGVGVSVGIGVYVGIGVELLVGVGVGVCVGVDVGVLVGVDVGVDVGVLVGVLVGVDVGVLVGVDVGVLVGVDVGVLVGVDVGVGVSVLVGVGLGAFRSPQSTIETSDCPVIISVAENSIPSQIAELHVSFIVT